MLAAKLLKGGLVGAPIVRCSFARVNPVTPIRPNTIQNIFRRTFSEESRPRTYARRRSLKEIATQPTEGMR